MPADTTFDVPLASDGPTHIAELGRIAEEHPELQYGLEDDEFQPPVPASIEPRVAVQETIEDQPEVIEVDGGTVTISHDPRGWHGVLEMEDGGGKEVFHGKTQRELMTNVLAGKLKATAQIRKLNKRIKLGTPVDAPAVTPQTTKFQPKELTTNDIFEIKTALESDLDKASDLRFQKKYGMTEADFVALVHDTRAKADKGNEAYEELTIEGVSKEFLEKHKDDYHPYEENGDNLMSWLCKHKLNRQVTKQDNFGTISSDLLAKGLYTVENLEEALEDLQDSGLLIQPPQTEEETPVEIPPVEVRRATPRPTIQPTPPQSTRIVSQTRRPRGGLGIRSSSVSTHVPDTHIAPSAEDLENASTEQINELFASVRREKLRQANPR